MPTEHRVQTMSISSDGSEVESPPCSRNSMMVELMLEWSPLAAGVRHTQRRIQRPHCPQAEGSEMGSETSGKGLGMRAAVVNAD